MADRRDPAPAGEPPVPRDLPDQQADAGEDPWDVPRPAAADGEPTALGDAPDTGEEPAAAGDSEDQGSQDRDVPDTDEAGTGRQGAPHQSGSNPEQPVPDESSG